MNYPFRPIRRCAFLLFLSLTACSYIKSLFPDKEKDYQYTTEIPALKLPSDLGRQELLAAVPSKSSSTAADTAPESSQETPAHKPPVQESLTTTPIVEPVPQPSAANAAPAESTTELETNNSQASSGQAAIKHEAIPVEIVKAEDGRDHLRLGVNFDKAWRTVDKSLSRKSLEVTSRNRQERLFRVQFDPGAKKLQDGSIWDEALFIFSGFQGEEKEYIVQLIDHSTTARPQTDVVLLNKDMQAVNDSAAMNLLTLLLETIKTDFAK